MNRRVILSTLVAALLPAAAARGDELQTTVFVEYAIRELPTDPESPVVFRARLRLVKIAQNGNAIGWSVAAIALRQPGKSGEPDTLWTQALPAVPSPDGLWWVTHADTAHPAPAEFVLPPHLSGTATSLTPGVADLDFDLEGLLYAPPPEGPPHDTTASLNYSFQLVNAPEPEEEGEDEEVEVNLPDRE
jgi:hypothetical protein